MTVATPFYSWENIGHVLYDTLYPNFISLIQLNLAEQQVNLLALPIGFHHLNESFEFISPMEQKQNITFGAIGAIFLVVSF